MKINATIIGDIAIDIITNIENIGLEDADKLEHVAADISCKPGGTGTMFALAARKQNYGKVQLIGKIGATPVNKQSPDVMGQFILRELKSADIECVFSLDKERSTGIVTITYLSHNRRVMIASAGANSTFSGNDISEPMHNAITNSNILFVSGYALLSPDRAKAVIQLMQLAHENNKMVLLDLVPHEIYQYIDVQLFESATKHVHVLVTNIHTINHFLHMDINNTDLDKSIFKIAKILLEKHNALILRTNIYYQYLFDRQGLIESSSTRYEELAIESRRGFSEYLTIRMIQGHYERLVANMMTD